MSFATKLRPIPATLHSVECDEMFIRDMHPCGNFYDIFLSLSINPKNYDELLIVSGRINSPCASGPAFYQHCVYDCSTDTFEKIPVTINIDDPVYVRRKSIENVHIVTHRESKMTIIIACWNTKPYCTNRKYDKMYIFNNIKKVDSNCISSDQLIPLRFNYKTKTIENFKYMSDFNATLMNCRDEGNETDHSKSEWSVVRCAGPFKNDLEDSSHLIVCKDTNSTKIGDCLLGTTLTYGDVFKNASCVIHKNWLFCLSPHCGELIVYKLINIECNWIDIKYHYKLIPIMIKRYYMYFDRARRVGMIVRDDTTYMDNKTKRQYSKITLLLFERDELIFFPQVSFYVTLCLPCDKTHDYSVAIADDTNDQDRKTNISNGDHAEGSENDDIVSFIKKESNLNSRKIYTNNLDSLELKKFFLCVKHVFKHKSIMLYYSNQK